MAIGYICPCCGDSGERPEDVDNAILFMCAPCGEAPKAAPPDMTVHTIPAATPVVTLEASGPFGMLNPTEQAYAHALGRADWEGAKICLLQCSAESAPIFALLQLAFASQPLPELTAAALAAGLTQPELDQALMYAASFYGNVGNYKSFGDTKFVPELPAERLKVLLTAGKADGAKIEALWDECCARMYSLPPRQRQMGLGASNGISTYFSANCEEADADLGNKFLDSIGLSAYNTRLFKDEAGKYTVKLASAMTEAGDDPTGLLCKEHEFEGKSFTVTRGGACLSCSYAVFVVFLC